nr:hypothetical protein [Lysobacter enzymogenes]
MFQYRQPRVQARDRLAAGDRRVDQIAQVVGGGRGCGVGRLRRRRRERAGGGIGIDELDLELVAGAAHEQELIALRRAVLDDAARQRRQQVMLDRAP